jgi:hypothetical protein
MAEEKMRFYLSYQVKNWKPKDLKMPRFGTVAPSRAHYCVTTACTIRLYKSRCGVSDTE